MNPGRQFETFIDLIMRYQRPEIHVEALLQCTTKGQPINSVEKALVELRILAEEILRNNVPDDYARYQKQRAAARMTHDRSDYQQAEEFLIRRFVTLVVQHRAKTEKPPRNALKPI